MQSTAVWFAFAGVWCIIQHGDGGDGEGGSGQGVIVVMFERSRKYIKKINSGDKTRQ